MEITGLHLLWTYTCTFECEHCFVWGSPKQSGVMTQVVLERILEQARQLNRVRSVYFEGGEPFLYYASLLAAVRETAIEGYSIGIVTNAFWATSREDALANLQPFAGLVDDLSVSSDMFHWDSKRSPQVEHALEAAAELGIPAATIEVAGAEALTGSGQLPAGESGVMFRGRAAATLAPKAQQYGWDSFRRCEHEDLVDPGRVHIDPYGNVHVCQGLTIGNLNAEPLKDLFRNYDPERHPVVGPLLAGGPAGLAQRYGLTVQDRYADGCHLCYEVRRALRGRFPGALGPGAVYGMY